ncbi:MAG: alpha/beta hydrolase [Gammaproteobacteria bacterium]|nr:alpha/beta hydrolase [Gammaproteobacteria bacterium]
MGVTESSQKLDVRGLQYHIQEWGDPSKPLLVLLHGWMDCGATYKYVAPDLVENFFLVAPDLRGFGETEHVPGGYYFPDYFADLEVILNHYSPNAPVNLVGHSMGGNIALMYAGIRPERIARVMSLESLGLMPTEPKDAVEKYRRWLREIVSAEPAKVYPHAGFLMQSIHKGNPSLPDAVIEELAELWGRPVGDDGAWMLKHDHAHRYANPVRYMHEDVEEIWQQISARVGLVMAEHSMQYRGYTEAGRLSRARELLRISDDDYYLIENCNHMLHLEQPAQTAAAIKQFFS